MRKDFAMHIGDAARSSGVSTKLIRYYESAGLLTPTGRSANGYRVFDKRNVNELRFIRRARELGFPVKQIVELLDLWRDQQRSSRKVRILAQRHQDAVVARMEAHRAIVRVLSRLIRSCKGDDRPDCPILDELSRGRRERQSGGARRQKTKLAC
jgi:MerR family transcriptional regulator, copper efflux regulator